MIFLEVIFPFLEVVDRDPNDVDNIDPEQINEEPEVDIVALADAIRDERAVMVEVFHADIACSAVHRTLRPEDHARKTKFQASDECFLAIETINDEVILEFTSPLVGVVVVGLLGNHSRVSRRCLI